MEKDLENELVECQKELDFFREMIGDFMKIEQILSNRKKNTDIICEYILTLNIIGFFLVSKVDLLIVIKNLYKENLNETEQKFFIKKGYLIIYEVLNTFNKHNRFLKILTKIYPELTIKHNTLNTSIRNFKSSVKFDKNIKDIRNNVAGHFEESFVIHYDTIAALNLNEAKFQLSMFLCLLNGIREFVNEIEKEQNIGFTDKETLRQKIG